MGTIHVVENVRIYLYSRDHNPPHVHAFFAEHEALIGVSDGEVIRGHLPKQKLKLVQVWVKSHKTRLVDMFYLQNPQLRRP